MLGGGSFDADADEEKRLAELLKELKGQLRAAEDKTCGSYGIFILLTAGCYFGSLWLLRCKVKMVDMIESLKDNQE
ncbi:MAG: hypothetical protein LUF78_03925 [Clostridiales bacterium]|nr:hypothetical protein [Clostridiales bacterium]